jgi:hypothetical protein
MVLRSAAGVYNMMPLHMSGKIAAQSVAFSVAYADVMHKYIIKL